MLVIFSSIAPIFILMTIGLLVRSTSLLPASAGLPLSIFSINVSIPCLIFHIMASTSLDELARPDWWAGLLGVLVVGLFAFFAFELFLRKEKTGPAMISSLAIVFANAGFVGLSVIWALFPDNQQAQTAAGLTTVAFNLVAIIGQSVVLSWHKRQAEKERGGAENQAGIQGRTAGPQEAGRNIEHMGIKAFLRRFVLGNPILMATLVGLCVPVFDIPVWKPLDTAADMLGKVSLSVMLFTLGFTLRDSVAEALRGHEIQVGHQIWLCAWRLAGFPLVLLGVFLALDVDPLWASVSVIINSTGTAVMVASFAQVYRAGAGSAALTASVTNVLSLFSLMTAIWFLQRLGLLAL